MTGKAFLIPIFLILITCNGVSSQDIKTGKIKRAIHLSSDYILRNINPDGQFVYERNLNSKVTVKDNYNVLRHCGTIYAMGMQYDYLSSESMKLATLKTVDFARNKFLAPLPQDSIKMAMWSTPEYEKKLHEKQAKLGGAGLGIVALSQAYQLNPEEQVLKEMIAMGSFICFMQKTDGNFYSKYIPGKGGKNDKFKSLYYPGEAILGLITLYGFDKSDKWLDAAICGISYLANLRKDQQEIPGDHWALIASEQLLQISKVQHDPELRKLIIHHATQICRSMMKEQITNKDQQDVYGAYSYYGASTSASTALEGLISALQFLPKTTIFYKELIHSVEIGIEFLLKAQIKNDPYSGAFPYAVGSIYGKRKDVKKFALAKTGVRIDYVQHALSALIKYHQFKYPENS